MTTILKLFYIYFSEILSDFDAVSEWDYSETHISKPKILKSDMADGRYIGTYIFWI